MEFIDRNQTLDRLKSVWLEQLKTKDQNDPFVQGISWAITQVELMRIYTDWDDRKKLLQPRESMVDWGQMDAMVDGVMEYMGSNSGRYSPTGKDWFQDWLKDYMLNYGIKPTDLLMEDNEDGE